MATTITANGINFPDGSAGSPSIGGSDTNTGLFTGADLIGFSTGGSERLRIDSAGNVGLGVTPTMAAGGGLHIRGPQGSQSRLHLTTNRSGDGTGDGFYIIQQGDESSNNETNFINYETASMKFSTSGTERMRIHSTGNVGIKTSSPIGTLDVHDGSLVLSKPNSSGNERNWRFLNNNAAAGNLGLQVSTAAGGSTFSNVVEINSSGTLFVGVTSEPGQGSAGAQISNTSYTVVARNITSAQSAVFRAFGASGEFRTTGTGDAKNTNNSYGSTSDQELKENIIDANSQWNDIKELKVRNYNFKESTGYSTHKQIGVIAQELEASGLNGLVHDGVDEIYDENDTLPEGKNIGDVKEKGYKSVKYSVLYMKAIKALQEAMVKIETLEAKVAALEAG